MIISKKREQVQVIGHDIAMIMLGILQANPDSGEYAWSIGLNTRNTTLYIDRVSPGRLGGDDWHPYRIFRIAVSHGAASIVVCQNRLSEDPRPTEEDKIITHRLSRGGAALGINVLDHVILSKTRFFSFRQAGLHSRLYVCKKQNHVYLRKEATQTCQTPT